MDEMTERENDVKFLQSRIDGLLRANNIEVERRRMAEQKAERLEREKDSLHSTLEDSYREIQQLRDRYRKEVKFDGR